MAHLVTHHRLLLAVALAVVAAACSGGATTDPEAGPFTADADPVAADATPEAAPSSTEPAFPPHDARVDLWSNHVDAPAQVGVGSRVLVVNRGPALHDWTNRDGAFATGRLSVDEVTVVTLDEVGTFAYVCELHPIAMRGEIEVVDGPVEPPPLVDPDGTVHVELVENAFVGPDVIPVGSTLTVTNIGSSDHDLTTEDGALDTGTLGPEESTTLVLDTPGLLEWVCSLHPNDMRRTITVT